MLLEAEPELIVIGEAATIEEARAIAARERPAVVIVTPRSAIMALD